MTEQISFDQLMQAYGVWRELTHSPKNKNTTREFFKFLGVGENSTIMSQVYAGSDIPTHVVTKLKWLTGPNARSLYEAWKVKNENSKDARYKSSHS